MRVNAILGKRFLQTFPLPLDPLAQSPREVLRELPSGAARARAARRRPFQGVALDLLARRLQGEVIRIAEHHFQVFVLAAAMKAEPKTESVGEGNLLLHRLARIDRARALVIHHLARQEMPAVRSGVEKDVVRPSL